MEEPGHFSFSLGQNFAVAKKRNVPIHETTEGSIPYMMWPAWLWIGTRSKFALWLSNRLATWTGSFWFVKRFRGKRPLLWLWLFLINAVSFALLVMLLFWLYHRSAV